MIVPAAIKTSVETAVPLPDGGDILLTQREAVNDAWDLPKSATMDPFVERHPEWADYTEISQSFEWKWYYAFQQVGDQTVEPLSLAYREGASGATGWPEGLPGYLRPHSPSAPCKPSRARTWRPRWPMNNGCATTMPPSGRTTTPGCFATK